MQVQTITYESLYAGKQEVNLCESCSNHVEDTLRSSDQYIYFSSKFNAKSNWHEGICEEHEYHQTCLNRLFRMLDLSSS